MVIFGVNVINVALLIRAISKNIIYEKFTIIVFFRRGTSVGLWVRSPLEEMKYLFKYIFSFLRSGVKKKARRQVLPLNTQCLRNSAENGERKVLTLGYLTCCVRHTT